MPNDALLIIITGAPATGKTSLGRRIAAEFSLPFYSKDDFKEVLFESLGWSDVAWSRKVGAASFALLRAVARIELAAARSLIIEGNFRPEYDNASFEELARQTPCRFFQIFCTASPETLSRRYQDRWHSGTRHPGYVENQLMDTFASNHLNGSYAPLAIEGTIHTLDTTDFSTLDLAPLLSATQLALVDASPEPERSTP